MSIRVAVIGAGGKMGQTTCAAVAAADDLELVGVVDPGIAGRSVGSVVSDLPPGAAGLEVVESVDDLAHAGVSVAVDFTHLGAARDNLAWLAANGIHAVVGTTGFTEADLARLRSEFRQSNCLIAPNFAIGALLMMRFAAAAAPYFDTAEIIEFHHDAKLDAPSGTATLTAERMADAMAAAGATWPRDPTETTVYDGARGGEGPGGVRVHSVRMRGMVAHQEVVLGTQGQTLTIRHDSIDRTSFMPGVLLAIRSIADTPGVTIGLDSLLTL